MGSWMTFWKDPKNIEMSKINSRNRCGGENAVATGTHTGGSISIGEHGKRLVSIFLTPFNLLMSHSHSFSLQLILYV